VADVTLKEKLGRLQQNCAQKSPLPPRFWAQPSFYSVHEWRERNPLFVIPAGGPGHTVNQVYRALLEGAGSQCESLILSQPCSRFPRRCEVRPEVAAGELDRPREIDRIPARQIVLSGQTIRYSEQLRSDVARIGDGSDLLQQLGEVTPVAKLAFERQSSA
jgi:hypothetical protein